MPSFKTQAITFLTGTGLLVVGASGIPPSEVYLVAGSSLAAFGYGLLFLSWREKVKPSMGRGDVVTEPGSKKATFASSAKAGITQTQEIRLQPPGAIGAPSHPSEPGGGETIELQQAGSTSAMSSSANGTPPPLPSLKSRPAERRVQPLKIPKVTIPKYIVEHKVPIALIALGLPLIVGGLWVLNPSVALGAGLLIPGILLFGVGSLVLLLQLFPRQVELRRFCMHCGFQMTTVELACGRCHKQPPSGIDTRTCANCSSVIPALAKFCRDCGAGQSAPGG